MPNPDGSPTLQELLAANPGMSPGGMSPPVTAQPSLQDDLLARLDANPNGKIAPLTPGQEGGHSDRYSAISPRQPESVVTGKMVPVYNAGGSQIGTEPETINPPLFQNPFAPRATPPVPSGGPIGSEAPLKDQLTGKPHGGAINYAPTGTGATAPAPGTQGGNGFFVPAGAGKG